MSDYEAKITARFGDQKTARLFLSACDGEGLFFEREGATVTINVWRRGDQEVVCSLVEEFGGTWDVEVLYDDE